MFFVLQRKYYFHIGCDLESNPWQGALQHSKLLGALPNCTTRAELSSWSPVFLRRPQKFECSFSWFWLLLSKRQNHEENFTNFFWLSQKSVTLLMYVSENYVSELDLKFVCHSSLNSRHHFLYLCSQWLLLHQDNLLGSIVNKTVNKFNLVLIASSLFYYINSHCYKIAISHKKIAPMLPT